MRLEAIGDDQSKQILKQGIGSKDPEVRFYSAEALAYLDDTSAVGVLGEVARDEPSFRVNALAALSAMDDASAYEALRSLLEVKSAETRYGAFRALCAMNSHDGFLHDEFLSNQFHYHVLDVPGPEMVHVTQSHLPEIVLFGKDQKLQMPFMLDAGKSIMVNGMKGDKITVSKFATGGGSPSRRSARRVWTKSFERSLHSAVLIRTLFKLCNRLRQMVHLHSRFEVDALAASGPVV